MIREDLEDCFLSVISHARPTNVPAMEALIGPATWFVGKGEAAAYQEHGAHNVVESGGLCRSRNAAIENSGMRHCIQLSDDLRKVQVAITEGRRTVAKDIPFVAAVRLVRNGMRSIGAKLGGAAPTANPFYASVDRPVHPSAFIVGDFIIIAPSKPRFDESLALKEDYDFTLQHIARYGSVARHDAVLMSFAHRTNAGGAVEVRTDALEQECIAALREKWPLFIRNNPRRPNEILLKLPTRSAR